MHTKAPIRLSGLMVSCVAHAFVTTVLAAGPALQSPPNNAVLCKDSSVDFVWAAAPNAGGYELQMATSPAFPAPIAIVSPVPRAEGNTLCGFPSDTLYWRVRTGEWADRWAGTGEWSEIWRVILSRPGQDTLIVQNGSFGEDRKHWELLTQAGKNVVADYLTENCNTMVVTVDERGTATAGTVLAELSQQLTNVGSGTRYRLSFLYGLEGAESGGTFVTIVPNASPPETLLVQSLDYSGKGLSKCSKEFTAPASSSAPIRLVFGFRQNGVKLLIQNVRIEPVGAQTVQRRNSGVRLPMRRETMAGLLTARSQRSRVAVFDQRGRVRKVGGGSAIWLCVYKLEELP